MPSTNQIPGHPGYPTRQPAVANVALGASSTPARSAAASAQQRQQQHDGQFSSMGYDRQQLLTDPESWIEVSSHPSSSSVSSIGDEIDTTGLQVGSANRLRRRRPHQQPLAHAHTAQTIGQGHSGPDASSQEEYDETESEEDHLLTSSTENIISGHAAGQTPLRQVFSAHVVESDSSDEDDDDENATALGRRPSEPFRPQPNAFSHPPSHLLHRHSTSSAASLHHRRPSFTRRSHTRASRGPDFMSPNYQADNDAALRASLTTLLSCAAAARSIPRDGEKELSEQRAPPVTGNQPVALRFAPESELMAPSPSPEPSRGSAQAAQARTAPVSPPSPASREKIKRTATPTSTSKSPRATKKKRTATSEDTLISPTLLTWVVSAGVVVLVSVVGFGAGYVIGREVGRQESLNGLVGAGNMSVVSDGGSCGREVLKSSGGTLRRFRWGSGIGRSVVA
ncbi:hypothetical protein F5B22DRAFT_419000 [Xylaria bambusicola]|uniref:uncharacterized protein n=1 Tax=Xylaria bambusicola TaxID=326684 RepID=UPI0020078C7D|nr:uncharacterized protein F5B22DRAFT_419000 [Xylaria bambusicola]KAI0523838.1 hypothetical protein F5B22DRAFT_419000 [Xylaria bambusicola]